MTDTIDIQACVYFKQNLLIEILIIESIGNSNSSLDFSGIFYDFVDMVCNIWDCT